MNGYDETQPDDLAPGVYTDAEGDLWAVDRRGMAVALTSVLEADLFGSPRIIPPDELGSGIPADQAHAAYTLRLRFPF